MQYNTYTFTTLAQQLDDEAAEAYINDETGTVPIPHFDIDDDADPIEVRATSLYGAWMATFNDDDEVDCQTSSEEHDHVHEQLGAHAHAYQHPEQYEEPYGTIVARIVRTSPDGTQTLLFDAATYAY